MTTETLPNSSAVTFDQFREEWLREFTEEDLSSVEKGQRFGLKIATQWLDVNEDDEKNLIICDGSGDGGIDIAYLRQPDVDADEEDAQDSQSINDGDIWYLFQSKYGSSFRGQETILTDGRKVIATLTGKKDRLSESTRQLLERLHNFRQQASKRDRIVLVFATECAMSESDRQALEDLRVLGRESLGDLFDVEDVSLNTIWENQSTEPEPVSLPIKGIFVDPSPDLHVGTVSLTDLYEFLKGYRAKTGNLDQLYERNVRQFLGRRRKINRGIADTLNKNPGLFGLYNNGITIVVSDFSTGKIDDSLVLVNPYVVNGCQTTKTIWEVLERQLEAGGTGHSSELDNWRAKAERGVVVTKIVKGDSASINEITRYTNSQNAVREQDFLALDRGFRKWAEDMADRYDVFLEIQRGGWDSRRAYQEKRPNEKQYTKWANAFDLIKVYGAGWLCESGHAFGRSGPFLPGGFVFQRITRDEPISAEDLYAAYQLRELGKQFSFGRGNNVKPSRGMTRYFFYFVSMELLRDVLIREDYDHSPKGVTKAFHILLQGANQGALQLLLDAAIEVVDLYVNRDYENSVFKESGFTGDLNAWFKSEALSLGKGERTYRLNSLLESHKSIFSRAGIGGAPSPRSLIDQAITKR